MQALRSIHLCQAVRVLVVTRDAPLEVVSAHAVVVETTAGRVWLTRDRECRDDVLDTGQCVLLRPGQKACLSGLPVGTARFTRAEPATTEHIP